MQMWQKSIKSDKNDANVTKIDQMTQKSIKWHKNRCNDTKKIITQQKKSSRNKKIITQKKFYRTKKSITCHRSCITHHTSYTHQSSHTRARGHDAIGGPKSMRSGGGHTGPVRGGSDGSVGGSKSTKIRSKIAQKCPPDEKSIKKPSNLMDFFGLGDHGLLFFRHCTFQFSSKRGGRRAMALDGQSQKVSILLQIFRDALQKRKPSSKKPVLCTLFSPCVREKGQSGTPHFFSKLKLLLLWRVSLMLGSVRIISDPAKVR